VQQILEPPAIGRAWRGVAAVVHPECSGRPRTPGARRGAIWRRFWKKIFRSRRSRHAPCSYQKQMGRESVGPPSATTAFPDSRFLPSVDTRAVPCCLALREGRSPRLDGGQDPAKHTGAGMIKAPGTRTSPGPSSCGRVRVARTTRRPSPHHILPSARRPSPRWSASTR
jgi:hypothetical protein